jgi:hypothetical protein
MYVLHQVQNVAIYVPLIMNLTLKVLGLSDKSVHYCNAAIIKPWSKSWRLWGNDGTHSLLAFQDMKQQ